MSASLEDVAEALREHDIHPEIINVGDDETPVPGINLRMVNAAQRVADDTLWPPVKGDQSPTWAWGDRFQFHADADATPAEIAEAIENTVRARA